MLSISNIMLLIVYLFLTIGGLMFIKSGGGFGGLSLIDGKLSISLSIKSILGIILYLFSFLSYIFVISKFDISYILPIINGLVTLISITLALIILKEKMTPIQILGAIIIVLGLILMNLKKN